MTTPFYQQSSMCRISREVGDFILSVTQPSCGDPNDRVFTNEFLQHITPTGVLKDIRFGLSVVQIIEPREDDTDRRPMLWLGISDYFHETNTATVLRVVLQKCKSSDVITFDWLLYNSTMRVSETIGGFGYVTATDIKFLSTKSLSVSIIENPELVNTLPWAEELEVNPGGNYRPK